MSFPRKLLDCMTEEAAENLGEEVHFHSIDCRVHPRRLRRLLPLESKTLSIRDAAIGGQDGRRTRGGRPGRCPGQARRLD